ncbi:MAG: hypothetical protein NTZ05_11850 [Chloroflexi bacterium]|nr:hypothetical protein [Chloroflexota bacterium]
MTGTDDQELYRILYKDDRVKKQYDKIYGDVLDGEKRRFDAAIEQLRRNLYPNNDVPLGIIEHIGADWKYRVAYHYRIKYRIQGHDVIILDADNRKNIYRRF